MTRFMRQIVKDFDYYDFNVISKQQWEDLVILSQTADNLCKSIIAESIPWVTECFEKHEVFTICGL